MAQLKYYLLVFELNGVGGRHGILGYPKLRITEGGWLKE